MGVDRKTGGVHAHQVKCKGSGDSWIATRIAADFGEFGYGGSRVVLKADQEGAIADVQRQVVAVRSGETVPTKAPWANRRATAENAVQRVQGLIRTPKRRVGDEYENQVKRPDIPVDGRVVSRIDHKIC